jgi:HprK-related kinase B
MPDTVEGLIDELEAPHPTELRLELDFEGCGIALRSNSPELMDELAYYFKEFRLEDRMSPEIEVVAVEAEEPALPLDYTLKQPDPGKEKIKEEFVDFPDGRIVRKRLTGMHFLFSRERHLAIGPCEANPNQVINFVNNRFIQWTLNRRYLLCHAAAVARDGRGLAVAATSGGGKSTLALQLMRRDLTFISNDRLMIQRDDAGRLQMLGVAKLPRINPGTVLHNPALTMVMPPDERDAAAALPPGELWDLEQKYDVFIEQCFGPGRYRLAAEVAALVLLNWRRDGGETVVRRVSLRERPDLVALFRKDTGLFYLPPRGAGADPPVERYVEVVGDTPVLELTGGVDFDRGVDACLELL